MIDLQEYTLHTQGKTTIYRTHRMKQEEWIKAGLVYFDRRGCEHPHHGQLEAPLSFDGETVALDPEHDPAKAFCLDLVDVRFRSFRGGSLHVDAIVDPSREIRIQDPNEEIPYDSCPREDCDHPVARYLPEPYDDQKEIRGERIEIRISTWDGI